jgi:hypothetical protein
MSQWVLIAANLVAIVTLVFAIYFLRHRRRDLVVAYLGVNAGVLAISTVLSSVNASVGLGLGLFGMLSIIRLRSIELDQQEVAYYFAALALGLLGGIRIDSYGVALAAMALLLGALWFGDHPRLLARYRVQALTLDRAFVDEGQLSTYLAELFGAPMQRVLVRRTDFVNDTTNVEVRYQIARPVPARATALSATATAAVQRSAS